MLTTTRQDLDALALDQVHAVLRGARGGRSRRPSWRRSQGRWVALALGLYAVRMFGITAGYHRYFSHRAYRTSRAFQLVLAVLGALGRAEGAALVGRSPPRSPPLLGRSRGHPLAARARLLVEPRRLDPRAPLRRDEARPREGPRALPGAPLARPVAPRRRRSRSRASCSSRAGCPRCCGASSCPPCSCGTARSRSTRSRTCSAAGATRRATARATASRSRSSRFGEGWHNNHHFYPSSANQGFFWWEVDASYYALRAPRGAAGGPGAPQRRRTACGSRTAWLRRRRRAPPCCRTRARRGAAHHRGGASASPRQRRGVRR